MTTQEIIAATLRMNDLAHGYLKRAEAAEARYAALEALVRELRDAALKAAVSGKVIADELMTEFISKTCAAKWNFINEGLLACDALLILLAHVDKALAGELQEVKP